MSLGALRHKTHRDLALQLVRMASNSNRFTSARRISRLSGHILAAGRPSGTDVNHLTSAPLSGVSQDRTAKLYSSGHGITNNAAKLEPGETDWSLPNETWSQETLDLYNQLKGEADRSEGQWIKMPVKPHTGETRYFARAAEERGKVLEYALFVNKAEQKLRAVVQFGPYTMGPKGYVHGGGTTSTVMDVACGICVIGAFGVCVTASLTVNYKAALPLNSTVLIEAKVDRVDGRKVYSFAEMRSPDGTVLYATATALFIQVPPEVSERLRTNVP